MKETLEKHGKALGSAVLGAILATVLSYFGFSPDKAEGKKEEAKKVEAKK